MDCTNCPLTSVYVLGYMCDSSPSVHVYMYNNKIFKKERRNVLLVQRLWREGRRAAGLSEAAPSAQSPDHVCEQPLQIGLSRGGVHLLTS